MVRRVRMRLELSSEIVPELELVNVILVIKFKRISRSNIVNSIDEGWIPLVTKTMNRFAPAIQETLHNF